MRHVFQPIWDLRSGSLSGFEALPRFPGGTPLQAVWTAACKGNVCTPLDQIAARQAVLQGRRLPGLLFVNFGCRCTASRDAAQQAVATTLSRGRSVRGRLVFELEEGEIGDVERAAWDAARLSRLGICLALDGAGAGGTPPERLDPLVRLLRFVKLDRSLVALWLEHEAEPLARWVAWARSHRLPVIAAGVEDRSASRRLRRAGIRAAQGRALGEPAPAARWTPERLSELAPSAAAPRHRAPARPPAGAPVSRPEEHAGSAPPPTATPPAGHVPSWDEIVAHWRPLYRDDTWMSVVRDLQRHLNRLTGADSYALWACLPPHGHWLRVTWASRRTTIDFLPPGTEPLAAVRAGLQPLTWPPAPVSPTYGHILDAVGIDHAWLAPLTLPDPAGGSPQFVGVLSLGWFAPPSAPEPNPAPAGAELSSVIAYLLGQRIQDTFIEAAMEWIAAQPAPATAAEWLPLLGRLADWFGGDHWALSAVDASGQAGQALVWDLMAESGGFPGIGAEWADRVNRFGDALATAPGLRTAAQNRIAFLADLSNQSDAGAELRAWQLQLLDRGLRSLIALPLGQGGDGRTGVMVLYWKETQGWQRIGASARPWEALRRLLAGWWREMTSTRNMLHDPLTGVLNRRGVARAWAGCRSNGGVLGILDCDGFHQVNNLWGHLVGDDVLRSLGGALADEARQCGGWCGRWGGDEFTVGLPEGSTWSGFGRRIQRRLADLAVERGWPQRITVSGGAVRWAAPKPACETALDFADRALYRAKNGGGGRFRLHRRTLGRQAG